MSNFIFIYGAFHGAWCWQKTIEELRRLGHRGYAADLPGHGRDPTSRNLVTLESCISATCEFIGTLPLENFPSSVTPSPEHYFRPSKVSFALVLRR